MEGIPPIAVRNLTIGYGDHVIQRDLSFRVEKGQIFVVMGGSGCGKSTLLRHMVGLMQPIAGEVSYRGESFWPSSEEQRTALKRYFGVLFQRGALWSAMTLAENVALPLEQFTALSKAEIDELAAYKLALVGLSGYENYYPAQVSGGMQKRAGLARAMALDPEILFFDEPSAGLDPVNARMLDDLMLSLRDSLGATFVVVTHELESIFTIGDNSVFLDQEAGTIIAAGAPRVLMKECGEPKVRAFLSRDRAISDRAML